MAIKIPQNKIISNYTAGKEYILETTYKEYIGYYYELNNKTFAGKEFSTNAPVILKKDSSSINKLLENPLTRLYGKISGTKIDSSIPSSFVYNYESNTRYFIYQINKKQIKEINEDTFNIFQKNPLFISVKLSFTSGFNEQELNDAEQKIPGIKTFANTSYTPPPVEDDGTIG
jgi:hypothetical protein